jgi:hypothetical protein
MESRHFSILDVGVSVSGEAADLGYADAFVDAYASEGPPAGKPRVRVEITRGEDDGLTSPTGGGVWVHHSKHDYWNIRGWGVPGSVRWLGRPVRTTCEGMSARVITPPNTSSAVTGESGWHICRSVALYARDPRPGKLLHASAVAIGDKAVAFVGGVSAGKTTLMTEAVLRHRADPLANDRLFVRAGNPPMAVSWPSYASYTEGTLLHYEKLHYAALAYEAGKTGPRTQTWGRRLRRRYTKDAKRVFPMRWLTDAVGRPYRREAPLAAVIVSTVSPDVAEADVTRLNLADGRARSALVALIERESFDAAEPSFCPWHGLRLPGGAMSAEGLVTELRHAAIPVLRLQAPAPGFEPYLERALEELG